MGASASVTLMHDAQVREYYVTSVSQETIQSRDTHDTNDNLPLVDCKDDHVWSAKRGQVTPHPIEIT